MAPTERPRLSSGFTHHAPNPVGLAPDDQPALHAWAAHVAAGRIGAPTPMHPASLAGTARMEAILPAGRRGAAL